LSPVLVYFYRRAVKRLMTRSSSEMDTGERGESAHNAPPASNAGRSAVSQSQGPSLWGRMARRRSRLAIAYGIAGACYAAVLTALYAASHWDLLIEISADSDLGIQRVLGSLGLAYLIFGVPALLTVMHLYSASWLRQGLAVLVVVGGSYLLSYL